MKTAIMIGGPLTGPSNAAVKYLPLVSGSLTSTWASNISGARTPFAAAGTLSNLVVRLPTALAAGETWEFAVMKSGSATTLKVTIDSTGLVQADRGHTVSVSKGDTISLRSTPTGVSSVSPTIIQASFIFEGTTAGESVIPWGVTSSSSALFAAPNGSGGNATEALRTGTMPTAGDISELYIILSAAPGVGNTRTFTLRKNGVDTGLTVPFGAADTQLNATPTTVSYVAGDTLTINGTVTGTPAASSWQGTTNWKPTVDGEGLAFAIYNGAPSNTADRYANFNGVVSSADTTETNDYNIAPVDLTITSLRADISTAPGASKHRVFKSRKGGADAGQSVDITGAGSTSGTDGTDVSVTALDLLDVVASPSGTPAAVTWARTSAVVTVNAITPPNAVITELPFSNYVFEGLSGSSAATISGTNVSGVTFEAQIELEDATVVHAWSGADITYPTATTWTWAKAVAVNSSTLDYVFKLRNAANHADTFTATNKFAVGAVVVFNDQSQFEHMFDFGKTGNGVPSTPATNNVRAMWCTAKDSVSVAAATAANAVSGGRVNSATLTGSAITEMANQFGVDWPSGHVPLMIVDCNYSGKAIDRWNSDEQTDIDQPTPVGWGLLTGLATYIANMLHNRCTVVVRQSVLTSAGSLSTALDTLATNFDALYSSNPTSPKVKFVLMPSLRYGEPMAAGYPFETLRNTYVTKAAGGGRWSHLCFALDIHMDSDANGVGNNGHHQADGAQQTYTTATQHARGNRRLGRKIGRALGAWLQGYLGQTVTLTAAGPTPVSAMFTSAGKTAFTVTFDKALKQRDAGGVIRGCYLSTNSWAVSGGVFTGVSELVTGYTLSINSNVLTVSKDAGSFSGNPKFDVYRDAPFPTDVLPETTQATALDRSLYGTDSYDDGIGTGLQAVPIQNSGITINDYVAPGATVASGGMSLSLGLHP